MTETPPAPWLTIVGIGEDGSDGLSMPARDALAAAECVMGAARHLALLPGLKCPAIEWPVPFAEGIPLLLDRRGQPTVMLASGDPFWFGAGTSVTQHLAPGEWVAHPALSTFALAAARLGWPLEEPRALACMPRRCPGCARIWHLAAARWCCSAMVQRWKDWRVICANTGLRRPGWIFWRRWVVRVNGYAGSPLPDLRLTTSPIRSPWVSPLAGDGAIVPRTSGIPDTLFDHDGQITRRPVRALTLSALAPRAGEMLWDIGAGSGSIGIEWLLSTPPTAHRRSRPIHSAPHARARMPWRWGLTGWT